MFPNNYSFNPGVGKLVVYLVLDPITMTPMIGGNSFTVNPFGMPGTYMIIQRNQNRKSGKKCLLKIYPQSAQMSV